MSALRALTAAEVVSLWEWGRGRSSAERALAMLQAGVPGAELEQLSALTLGQRDALLLRLHELTIGDRLEGQVKCARCGELSDYTVECRKLLFIEPTVVPDDRVHEVAVGEERFRFRSPTTRDLERVAGAPTREAAQQLLVDGCIVDPRGALTDDARRAIGAAMLTADPQSDVELIVSCAACSNEWRTALHIEDFLWALLDGVARRHLREVAALAAAYGWREGDILSMSAARRSFYLQAIE